jgi:hypothetical protein
MCGPIHGGGRLSVVVFLAQYKGRSKVHKENKIKIENIEQYKNLTRYSLC